MKLLNRIIDILSNTTLRILVEIMFILIFAPSVALVITKPILVEYNELSYPIFGTIAVFVVIMICNTIKRGKKDKDGLLSKKQADNLRKIFSENKKGKK